MTPKQSNALSLVLDETVKSHLGYEAVFAIVIYEKTGQNGLRYASLSMGYSEEYDAETLNGYLPKKK